MKRMNFFSIILTVAMVACNSQKSVKEEVATDSFKNTPQEEGTVTIDLSVEKGEPRYYATGFLHGLSEDCSKPGTEFFDVLKPRNFRGANLGGFWLEGRIDQNLRMLKTYYDHLNPLGVTIDYILLDAWGFWYGNYFLNMPIAFPGDGGDWTGYEDFCETIATFVRDNGMRDFQYNLWNEPNLVGWGKSQFWPRPRQQFYEMWKRGYRKIKFVHPEAVISGPDYAMFSREKDWKEDLEEFLDFCKANDVLPQVLTLHALPADPLALKEFADKALADRNIADVSVYINEYACDKEQHPAKAAWYIARLERAGVRGGRAIWPRAHIVNDAPLWNVSGELNGLMYLDKDMNLSPTGIWWVYKRYADITGMLVDTVPSKGDTIDAVAGLRQADQKAQVLLGVNESGNVGNVTVKIKGLGTMSHWKKNGKVRISLERIPHNGGKPVEVPEVLRKNDIAIINGEITLQIPWGDAHNAYAVTLE